MKRLFPNKWLIVFYLTLLFIFLSLAGYLFIPSSYEGMILYGIILLITLIGLYFGPITVLTTVLLLYFFLGSVLFWMYLMNDVPINLQIPYIELFYWTIMILIVALISGRLSLIINELIILNRQLSEQIRTLVAVDSITGFDNESRLLMELELEFNRSKRYEMPFSLLIVKIKHLDQFKRLYGEQEFDRLYTELANRIQTIVRISDLKFRLDNDQLAFIFTNTPVENIQTIIKKFNQTLSVYQLKNNKYVNLEITYGYSGYPSNLETFLDVYDVAVEQVSFDET